jgi:formylglycine-generating enzyme required for sulfatase activity
MAQSRGREPGQAHGAQRRAKSEEIESAQVKLKPVMGLAPTQYVPIVLGFLVLVILFFLLVFPGLNNPGTELRVESEPSGASVYVDGTRIGATPLAHFLSAGTHELELRHPHFRDHSERIEVGSRLFGSLLFPRTGLHRVELDVASKDDLLADAAKRFSQWSLVGEANARYQFPPVLSDAVSALYTQSGAQPGDARGLLDAAMRDLRSPRLLKDYLRAQFLDTSGGQAVTGFHMTAVLSRLTEALDTSAGFPFLVRESMGESSARALQEAQWYRSFVQDYTTGVLPYTDEGDPLTTEPEQVMANGVAFRRLPARRYVMGMARGDSADLVTETLDVAHVAETESFLMMEREVSRALYARFLADVSAWRPSERSTLRERDLVTEGYLRNWESYESGRGSQLPVVNVSHHAATRFAEWFTRNLPSSLQDYRARLPREVEWEWAAYANGERAEAGVFADVSAGGPSPVGSTAAGAAGLHDLLGNVWEWQENWYHPGDYPVASPSEGISSGGRAAAGKEPPAEEPSDEYAGAHKAVRGGSWANRANRIDVISRGSQPPQWCTPFLGFRLVLVRQ